MANKDIILRAGKQLENLQMLLDCYSEDLEEAPTRLSLKGKTLGQANKEHVSWLVLYDEKRAELKILVKYVQSRVDYVRGCLFKKYTEKYSRELADRTKDKYIDHDEDYVCINEMLLATEEVYEKYSAVVEAFKSRGFALRNLVELSVHQLVDTPL